MKRNVAGARRAHNESLRQYTEVSEAAAAQVIAGYSTSFGAATKLLPERCRVGVRNVYALVRVADEIVDGVGRAAGLDDDALRQEVDALEDEVSRAIARGYSVNPIVHAFALTAREAGIGEAETRPFFESMRSDITTSQYDAAEHARYVYGSAEVVGLMCLKVFLAGKSVTPDVAELLNAGGRALGRAFQNVNFLRDIAADREGLQRDYLETNRGFSEADKLRWEERIRCDLDTASDTIPLLPADVRPGVAAAHGLFEELLRRIQAVDAPSLLRARISVPKLTKLGIVAKAKWQYRGGGQ